MKKWFMQKQTIDRLEREIIWCKNEIEIRQEMINHQNHEILELRQKILELEDDKKALDDLVKKGVEPIIHERQSKRKEP